MDLIVFSGLPGTGKSSVAEAVGRKLSIPVFAKDWLEASILRCGLGQNLEYSATLGEIGNELLTTLTLRQFYLGQSAILDSVAKIEMIRQKWRTLARIHNANWRVIECVCSDELIHRDRLSTRRRGIPGWYELTWSDIEQVRARYEPWQDERLILDSTNSLDHNIQAALRYLSNGK